MPRYGFHYDQITIDADYSNLTEARKHALAHLIQPVWNLS